MSFESRKKTRVAIIGAGAAGMSCAATLAKNPEKFEVTMFDIASYPGGQATSILLDESTYGANWLNDGVQGGSKIFRHTFRFFRLYGYEPRPVMLQVSFGKGRDNFWTNVFPSPLVDGLSSEIRKFGHVLRYLRYLMPIFGILPVKATLRLFGFSEDFKNKLVIPLLALFLGTGNQTPNIPSALLERIFNDPQMGLWTFDPNKLLSNCPQMFTFPNLGNFYRDWASDLRSKSIDIRLSTGLTVLERSKKSVILQVQPLDGNNQFQTQPSIETFDKLVFCCPADEARKLLGQQATWREKFILGGVKFYNDVTVTHSDSNYFERTFETHYDPNICGKSAHQKRNENGTHAEQPPYGQNDFRPMYYTHTVPQRSDKVEMGFDCSHYQHQFHEKIGINHPPRPEDRHVYQSIFLDDKDKRLWTWNKIDQTKIIACKWWHQFGHRWQHYLRVVLGMVFINGTNQTLYAGAWTMVNMHEVACVSGIAAAYRLGAMYEPFDEMAEDFFSKYLLLCHGMRYKKKRDVILNVLSET